MTPTPTRASVRSVPSSRSGVILVLYYAQNAPLRASVADQLYSFRRYSGRRCIYINLAVRRIPRWIDRLDVDLVVFSTVLLAQRWHRPTFRRAIERLQPVKRLACTKVVIPQDEYIHTNALSDFIREFDVDWILSNAPESEWPVIYGELADGPAMFTQVLTGYIEPETMLRIERLANGRRRTIDVGYRAYDPEFSLGRHAQLKSIIAPVFKEGAAQAGMTADISLRAQDTLLGDDWYRFLLKCRWVVGVEGGAGLLDRDGTLLDRSRAFQSAHPEASFEEVEAACFPGMDGNLRLFAISPRHLEACVTKTAQVLVEGTYNGILQRGVHYIPVRADFSDVADVVMAMRDERLRARVANRAYEDIVASGLYTYPSFVRTTLDLLPSQGAGQTSRLAAVLAMWDEALDGPSWLLVRASTQTRQLARGVLGRIGLLEVALRVRARTR